MKKLPHITFTVIIGVSGLCSIQSVCADTESFKWRTVVDNNKSPPGIAAEKYFSYNQPSLNDNALVVFRARAKPPTGGQGGGEPTRGIFTRNMLTSRAINTIASTKPPKDVVPAPNNITNPKPATFNEFPAFPRIDKLYSSVAFRGQSQPTWEDPVLGKLGGTAGVYANTFGELRTGVRNLEVTAAFSQYFVPTIALSAGSLPTRFDQFPGAPGISEKNRITFKGNYTDNTVSKTGIFYRSSLTSTSTVKAIAWTGLKIPDENGLPTVAVYGSTAPPSTANSQVVFAGFDNEENPSAGGIYHARLGFATPRLKALVDIGTPVPNIAGATFNRFGEALSFDGRYVSFWGAWGITGDPDPTNGGNGWKPIDLTCPKDGNKDVIKSCLDQDTSEPKDGSYRLFEPENQGMFVYDIVSKSLKMVAKTNDSNGFNDFLFWSFTGAPPGVGGGDEGSTDDRELPRWRSSAFAAVNSQNVAFKAKKFDGSNGIYLKHEQEPITTVLDSTMTGNVLDNKTIIVVNNNDGSTINVPLSQLFITALGLERDGFRNNRLAISASMSDLTATYSWAGIYIGEMDDD
ncbi:MAG: hypothetical protein IPN42_01355 [Methylococcaceae bacterium]|nr:hypothetical protein [Methylococcaceae bacterium]